MSSRNHFLLVTYQPLRAASAQGSFIAFVLIYQEEGAAVKALQVIYKVNCNDVDYTIASRLPCCLPLLVVQTKSSDSGPAYM